MEKLLRFLKALSDQTRLKIIELLIDGEKCVCEIFPKVKRSQSTISKQLSILREAGIVDSRKDGKNVFYFISNKKGFIDILKSLGYSEIKLKKKSNCCK